MVKALFKSGDKLALEMDTRKYSLMIGALDIVAAACAYLDAVKKYYAYNKADVDMVAAKKAMEQIWSALESAEFSISDTRLKKGATVQISAFNLDVIHAVAGIAGEAGELVECVLDGISNVHQDKEIDKENAIEELGDSEFYTRAFRNLLGLTREDALEANMDKLAVRYRDYVYSDAAAEERADKDE